MSERAFAPIYEISSENKIAGRRPIKVVLHEIFPDNTRWQENGISWKEEYVQANLHSVVGMSIVAEFLTEDRDVPYNHGMTDVREEDKLPLFEDATMVGHFDKAYVDDVEIGGVTKRCLVAEGTLDEMRYPKFVAWLRENMADSVVPWKLWVSPSTMDTLFTPAVGKRKVVFRSITITADMRFSVLNRLMKPPS